MYIFTWHYTYSNPSGQRKKRSQSTSIRMEIHMLRDKYRVMEVDNIASLARTHLKAIDLWPHCDQFYDRWLICPTWVCDHDDNLILILLRIMSIMAFMYALYILCFQQWWNKMRDEMRWDEPIYCVGTVSVPARLITLISLQPSNVVSATIPNLSCP